jgi:hypothetical protein
MKGKLLVLYSCHVALEGSLGVVEVPFSTSAKIRRIFIMEMGFPVYIAIAFENSQRPIANANPISIISRDFS